jgi:hypothetical protein
MMRTEAPKDREGRGFVNFARTTPEFPRLRQLVPNRMGKRPGRTMWSRHLAPDHPDLGSPNLLLAPVDVGNLLAQVEAATSQYPDCMLQRSARENLLGGSSIIDALDLDQAGLRVRGAATTLIA